MSIFLLSFSSERFSGNQALLDGLMNNHRLVDGWSSPFPGCYLFMSNHEMDEIRKSFEGIFEQKQFIIARIRRGKYNIDGRSVPEIWDWIKNAEPLAEISTESEEK